MVKHISRKITSILTLAIFLFTALASVPIEPLPVQAADGYKLGDVITSKVASATNNDYGFQTGHANSSKWTFMGGTPENISAYYYFYEYDADNGTYSRYTPSIADANRMRLSNQQTHKNIFDLWNEVFAFDTTQHGGKRFYSKSSDLGAKFYITKTIDSQAVSSRTMTYEFKVEYDENFVQTDFYVASGNTFNSSRSVAFNTRGIKALRVNSDGRISTGANSFTEVTSAATLSKGTEYTIGVVITLTPNGTKYDFEKTIYLDGSLIHNADSSEPISVDGLDFYGFDAEYYPWSVNTEFADWEKLNTDAAGQYCYISSSNKPTPSAAVTNEYTIIPAKASIHDFYVYAGNMYGDVLNAYKNLEQMCAGLTDGDELPTVSGDATISWTSSDDDMVSIENGNIITVNDASSYGYSFPATLTATISNSGTGETATKTISLGILRNTSGWSAQDFVNHDAMMPFSELTNESPMAVGTDITLPSVSPSGNALSWKVSKTTVAEIADNVLKITPDKNNPTSATLTLTVSSDGAEPVETKYDFTVVKAGYSDDEVYKWKHNLGVADSSATPAAGMFGDKISFENWGDINIKYSWPFVDDASGIVPANVNVRPVMIVGPFDNAISGFEAQAICQMAGGKLATDYEFEASANGISWDKIDAYYTKGPETKIPQGDAVWTVFEHMFRPSYIDTSKDYRYLKIKFSDASYVSTKYLAASALDSVAVYFDTDVTKAYKNLSFDDMSQEEIDSVNTDFDIPSSGTDGTNIEWTSSNPEVVRIDAASGKAIVNENAFYGYSIPVTLTATISKTPETETSGVAREKAFDITVVRNTSGWQAQDYVNYDVLYHDNKDHLTFDYFTDQPANMVATSIHLPKKLEGGGTFTWEIKDRTTGAATNSAKIDNYILSFTPQNDAITPLTLTVTSTKDGATASRSFDVDVVRGFSANLLLSANVSASTSGIRKALSRDVVTYWETSDSDNEKTIDIEFSTLTTINSGLIVNASDSAASFRLEVSEDGTEWETAYSGAMNGKLVREGFAFEETICKYARFTFTSATQVKIATIELYNAIVTDEQAMDMSLDAITVPTTVSDDFILPTTGAHIGTITWTSNNPRVIAISGNNAIVTRAKNENQTAVLTATLTHAPYEARTRQFTVTVAGIVSAGGGSGGGFGGGASGGIVASKDYITPSQSGATGGVFADVPSDHWAIEFITALTEEGIISKAENYRPSDFITREEFVKLLVVATGAADAEAADASFTDADHDAWYMPYISAAFAKGIVTGNADGSFGIGNSITRQDAAVIFYRAMPDKRVIDNMLIFTDSDTVSEYAAEAVSYLANERILNGYEDGSFRPFGNLTRAESAKIIYLLTTFAKEGYNAQ